jgi:hypothetical protein
MKHFTIDDDSNNIIVHTSAAEAEAMPNSQRFATEAALGNLAAEWPATRLVEIWSSLPGVTPVSKFKDRNTAVARIWKAPSEPRDSRTPDSDRRASERIGRDQRGS